jgi:NAD(P)-dependent dehydrogenase (short-subunit alcohol dehydrogenase family)
MPVVRLSTKQIIRIYDFSADHEEGSRIMKKPYGNVVFITGGSSGIGLSCARMFAKNGFKVFAGARAQGREKECFEGGGEIIPIVMDVTSEDSIKAAVDTVIGQAGEIGIMMHCAVMHIAGPAEDTPVEPIRRQMDTNYFGLLTVNRYILPYMRERGRGLIVIMSSIGGFVPLPFQSHYSSVKFALEAYARALRTEISPFGIKVTVIQPGDTRTNVTDARHIVVPQDSPYIAACRTALTRIEHDERNGRSPETVSRALYKIAQRRNPPMSCAIGLDSKSFKFLIRIIPERVAMRVVKAMYGK